jgi:serine/threonine protein kinase
MTPERWRRVEEVYHAALTRGESERMAFVASACADDESLRLEVESLLAQAASADGVLAGPAGGMAAKMVSEIGASTLTGRRLGAYQVHSRIGAGGMGEVYRARDTKLGRDVAIKILPRLFTSDPERLARFEREARVLASLNHPHIGAIYGLEDADGLPALVLELVDGETLADRIARGPIPLTDALAIARQIADALEAAHERDIVHRDVKPANIKVTPNGVVKVLDFGLAKISDAASGGASSLRATTPAVSTPGVILGTAAYMSPEQAKGKEAGRTSDVWAFGCVLYELLTGRRVFEGVTAGEVLGEVLQTEPDWGALPDESPESIRRLLRRCLQKEPRSRLHDMADVRLEIEDAQIAPTGAESQRLVTVRPRTWPLWTALACVTFVAVAIVMWVIRARPTAPEVRLEVTTPPSSDPVSLAVSPDGERIVFSAGAEDDSRLWVRALNSVSTQTLTGTRGARFPFWSPDSRSIGFFADGKLKRIDVDSGAVDVLADASMGRGGTWNQDGVILFTQNTGGSIVRVSASGGSQSPQILGEAQGGFQRFPQFLPDGRHFLYYVIGSPEVRGVYVGTLDGLKGHRVLDADAPAVYTASGLLLFVRQATLLAQGFDPIRGLSGTPFTMAQGIAVDPVVNVAALSTSAAGPIVYRTGLGGGQRQLVWFDRSGKTLGKVGDPDNSGSTNPSLSPDGQLLARNRTVNGNNDVWVLELGRGVLSRSTFDAGNDIFPVWSPDGGRIVFASDRQGAFADLYEKPASGEEKAERLLLATPQSKYPTDWSPDGRFVLYRATDTKTGQDVWAVPLVGDRKPSPVFQTTFDERDGQFSPDGQWVAYESNESGRSEIYVEAFPPAGGKRQISTNGGAQVRWRRDGTELFYIALDGRLIATPIRFASNRRAVEPGSPVPLFTTAIGGALQGNLRQQYSVSPDGNRFLMNTVAGEAVASPITIVLNLRPGR